MAEASLTLAYMPGVTPAKWLRIWAERHPRDPLAHFPTDAAQQTAVLHDGRADLCVVRLPIDDTDLHVIPLYEETAVVVVPADHAIAELDAVQLGDLAGETMLDLPELDDRQLLEVVATGAGLAILPQAVARLHARKDLRARPVTDAPTTRIALAWRRDAESPLIDDFIGVVRGRTARSSRGADGEAAADTGSASKAAKAPRGGSKSAGSTTGPQPKTGRPTGKRPGTGFGGRGSGGRGSGGRGSGGHGSGRRGGR